MLSTSNLVGFYKKELVTDEQLIEVIQRIGPSGTDQYFCYAIDNSVFHIHILGGELGTSVPNAILKKLSDYEFLTIKIWDHKEIPPGDYNIEPQLISAEPDSLPSYNVRIFPHQPIQVRYDERFKEQLWAKKFKTLDALLPPSTISNIIRYCEKISHLKAFW